MDKVGVLIVDDEHDVRMLLGTLLEEEGYRVYQAADGNAALEHLRAHPEGLVVLLDVLMPMDGIATLKAVETDASLATGHPYILMTALASPLLSRSDRSSSDSTSKKCPSPSMLGS